jgi:pseudaminic acid synthase
MKFKKPYFIAEISANHCGSYQLAKKLIKCAKINGADAVKLQTYTADMMTIKSKKKYFKIKKGLWKGYELWDLYNKAHTPLNWHKSLFNYAKKIGIDIFSTPFSEEAVDFLETLKCPIYKIASFEMTDHTLVKRVAKTKKPIIISTGMASISEIASTVKIARDNGSKEIILLYCVSNYPSKINDFDLTKIKELKKKFNCSVGLSDHSKGNFIAPLAVSLGAEFFEKHIALDNQKKGVDIEFSAKGKQIKEYSEALKDSYSLLYSKKNKLSSDYKMKVFRRSIFAVENIEKGEKFTKFNIKRIRPGHGIAPYYYEKLLGKKNPRKIKKGEPLKKIVLKII